jgi:hypothetical protein
MLPKTKDGEIDTYLVGAPIALGAILSIIAMVFLMFHLAPSPLGSEEKAAQTQKADKASGAATPAAKGAH